MLNQQLWAPVAHGLADCPPQKAKNQESEFLAPNIMPLSAG